MAKNNISNVNISIQKFQEIASRQQIRNILYDNAQAINDTLGAETIRTCDQLHARNTDHERRLVRLCRVMCDI
jgi:hypothetical protein